MKRYPMFFLLGVLALSLALFGCFPKPQTAGGGPPVIDGYFASPHVQSGQDWKVYVKAHDPDGDMWLIDWEFEGPGLPLHQSRGQLSKRMQKEFNGYFYLRTTGLSTFNIKVTMWLTDKGNRSSQKIVMRLKQSMEKAEPVPAGFEQNRLLAIPYGFARKTKIKMLEKHD